MLELWRTVAECDRYEVSSLGNVRHKANKKNLKLPVQKTGYTSICLGDPNVRRYVHRLVCIAWHGEPPKGTWALHRNGVKTDNRPENLYWGTPMQNCADAAEHGTKVQGESCGKSKLTEQQVREIRALREQGWTYQRIADHFAVQRGTVTFICKRQTWRHIA